MRADRAILGFTPRCLFILSLMLFGSSLAVADECPTWVNTYSNFKSYDAAKLIGEKIALVGRTQTESAGEDVRIITVNRDGELLHDTVYGGDEYDSVYSASPASDGGVLTSGWSYSFGGPPASIIVKEKEEVVEWLAATPNHLHSSVVMAVRENRRLGKVFGVGHTTAYGENGLAQPFFVKLDLDGNIESSQVLQVEEYLYMASMVQAGNNDILAIGHGSTDPADDTFRKVRIFRVNSDLELQSDRFYGADGYRYQVGKDEIAVRDSGGNVYVTASRHIPGQPATETVLFKIDSNGDLVFEAVINSQHEKTISYSLQWGPQGTFFVGGWARDGEAYHKSWLARIDTNGNLLWEKTRSDLFHSITIYSLAVSRDGFLYELSTNGSSETVLRKTFLDGTECE